MVRCVRGAEQIEPRRRPIDFVELLPGGCGRHGIRPVGEQLAAAQRSDGAIAARAAPAGPGLPPAGASRMLVATFPVAGSVSALSRLSAARARNWVRGEKGRLAVSMSCSSRGSNSCATSSKVSNRRIRMQVALHPRPCGGQSLGQRGGDFFGRRRVHAVQPLMQACAASLPSSRRPRGSQLRRKSIAESMRVLPDACLAQARHMSFGLGRMPRLSVSAAKTPIFRRISGLIPPLQSQSPARQVAARKVRRRLGMSNGAVVFHKTAKGVEEMEKRCHGLSPAGSDAYRS